MMSDLVRRNGGRAGLAALVAILLLGVGLRLDYAWEGRAPVFDATAYARIAESLERGDGFTLGKVATQPASNYSPGLPLLVAGIYELRGAADERLARVVLAVLGSLAVLFAYLIGRRLRGPGAGLLGAAAVAVYPALLEYQGMLMGEPLAATLLSAAVLSMLWAADPALPAHEAGIEPNDGTRAADRQGPHTGPEALPGPAVARWALPGVLLGALVLVRPEYLGVAVLLSAVVAAHERRRGWQSAAACAATLLAGVVLAVGPWTVRNAVVLDRFVPVSTGGGQVLFAGAYIPSSGDPERVGREVLERHPGLTRRLAAAYRQGLANRHALPIEVVLANLRLEQILAALAAQRYPSMETDRALARMGRERLRDDVIDEPLSYAGFLALKVSRAWFRGPREVMHRAGWEAFHWALLAFGLLGLVLLARERRWEALLLGTVLVAITAIVALLVASPRRALVTLPLVAPLAGTGLAFALGSLRATRRRAAQSTPRRPA